MHQPGYYFRWSDISAVYATKRKTLSRVLAIQLGISIVFRNNS